MFMLFRMFSTRARECVFARTLFVGFIWFRIELERLSKLKNVSHCVRVPSVSRYRQDPGLFETILVRKTLPGEVTESVIALVVRI